MSLINMMSDKIYNKKSEMRNAHRLQLEKIALESKKRMAPTIKAFNKKLDKLNADAAKAGVTISLSNKYVGGKNTRVATCVMAHTYDKAAKAKVDALQKKGKKELDAFNELSDRAQLAALLPAKERREEMLAIFNEIKKY